MPGEIRGAPKILKPDLLVTRMLPTRDARAASRAPSPMAARAAAYCLSPAPSRGKSRPVPLISVGRKPYNGYIPAKAFNPWTNFRAESILGK